jgi:hypothetical protein
MKAQKPLPGPSELRESFDKARREELDYLDKRGVAGILRGMSEAVKALQDCGADVRLDVIPGGSTTAYDLQESLRGPNNKGSCNINAYGYIRFGTASHLFAVSSMHDGVAEKKLYVSSWDVPGPATTGQLVVKDSTTRMQIEAEAFDFKTDSDALKKFQDFLVKNAAESTAVLESDSAGVFNKDSTPVIRKPLTLRL